MATLMTALEQLLLILLLIVALMMELSTSTATTVNAMLRRHHTLCIPCCLSCQVLIRIFLQQRRAIRRRHTRPATTVTIDITPDTPLQNNKQAAGSQSAASS
eukprot:COSAG05_NODE_109_length_18675_cov_6.774279_8_plen_102_part_00